MTKWRKYRIGNADKPGGSNDTSRKKKQRDATHESQIYIRQLLAREESLKRKRNEQQEKEQKKAKKKRKHDHPSNEDDEIEVVSATKLDIRCPITREIMTNPMKAKCVHRYEKTSIEALLKSKSSIACPVVGCNHKVRAKDLKLDISFAKEIKQRSTETKTITAIDLDNDTESNVNILLNKPQKLVVPPRASFSSKEVIVIDSSDEDEPRRPRIDPPRTNAPRATRNFPQTLPIREDTDEEEDEEEEEVYRPRRLKRGPPNRRGRDEEEQDENSEKTYDHAQEDETTTRKRTQRKVTIKHTFRVSKRELDALQPKQCVTCHLTQDNYSFDFQVYPNATRATHSKQGCVYVFFACKTENEGVSWAVSLLNKDPAHSIVRSDSRRCGLLSTRNPTQGSFILDEKNGFVIDGFLNFEVTFNVSIQ